MDMKWRRKGFASLPCIRDISAYIYTCMFSEDLRWSGRVLLCGQPMTTNWWSVIWLRIHSTPGRWSEKSQNKWFLQLREGNISMDIDSHSRPISIWDKRTLWGFRERWKWISQQNIKAMDQKIMEMGTVCHNVVIVLSAAFVHRIRSAGQTWLSIKTGQDLKKLLSDQGTHWEAN